LIPRPGREDYAPYYHTYVSKVPEGDLIELLVTQLEDCSKLAAGISEAAANASYAPEKWTIKQVFGHIADTERIMAYRLLRIARGDTTPLPGFEQDDYVSAADFNSLSLQQIVEEFRAVRAATIALLQNLHADSLSRRGTANGFAVTAQALAYVVAGHERHHIEILRSRYLK
jgi:uncharacterized damage-inducible protein DinB